MGRQIRKDKLVYATSNRRHLLPQLMKDNVNIYDGQTDEVNPYETIDETVSLSIALGLVVILPHEPRKPT